MSGRTLANEDQADEADADEHDGGGLWHGLEGEVDVATLLLQREAGVGQVLGEEISRGVGPVLREEQEVREARRGARDIVDKPRTISTPEGRVLPVSAGCRRCGGPAGPVSLTSRSRDGKADRSWRGI